MGWVGPLISGAALVLVAIIEAVAAVKESASRLTTKKATPL